ncbi:putative peptide zinc metalloprotease protein [Rathayibacter sp. PhB93]|uniref:daptide biosynthesis intramembrane metalloprotease n=1 Tax=unclassified Rathayibacter TaxID=2609250 RepID=UPI000F4A4271|nr:MULTISPECIES: daptide biosynthesis intramembrane metalloprotease [unclassified Rathayibacter]ROQ16175.1 putative peptide zinc metalloprotease protein [Rathayibacter sp. PhB93]TDQ16116.1 putative peptide zinc metalloprotease protein [Rathayibacter sp. PhB1]
MSDPVPRLADTVTIDEPIAPGAPWILSVRGVPRARVGPAVATFAAGLRPSAHETDETDGTGTARLSDEETAALLREFAAAGLLAGSERREPRSHRLQFRPPASFQLTLLDATRPALVLARLLRRRPIRLLAVAAVVAVLLLGTASAIAHSAEIAAVLSEPLPLPSLLAVSVAFLLAGAVHEAGHAVSLAAFGGRPRRAGVMIFYLAPAFFCDVTDGWRLGDRRSRAAVALAGPAVHLVLAAGAATALLWSSTGRSALACFVVAAALSAVTNLIPLVHLDGYLALVAVLDRPFLRRAAIRAVGDAVLRLLGGTAPRASPWLVLFGVGCRGFALLLIGWAYVRSVPVLILTEPGAVIALVFAAALLGALVVSLVRFARAAREARVGALRVAVASAVLAAALAGVTALPLEERIEGGYVVRNGEAFLVRTSADPRIVPGTPVRLTSNGIAVRSPRSTAVVSGPAESLLAPIAALAPLTGLDDVPAVGYPLALPDSASTPPVGGASVSLGGGTIGGAVLDLVAGDALRRLGVGR